MTYSRLAFGGSSLWLMSWCQTTSELPRLPIALPSTTILEMTATYGGVTTIRSPGAMSSSSEPAREGDQGVVVELLITEAKYEVVIPGFVNVSETLVVGLTG